MYCGKTADWIRIPFGAECGVGRGIGKSSLGVKCGRPIVNNGDCYVVVRERRALPKLLWGGLVIFKTGQKGDRN